MRAAPSQAPVQVVQTRHSAEKQSCPNACTHTTSTVTFAGGASKKMGGIGMLEFVGHFFGRSMHFLSRSDDRASRNISEFAIFLARHRSEENSKALVFHVIVVSDRPEGSKSGQ